VRYWQLSIGYSPSSEVVLRGRIPDRHDFDVALAWTTGS
jgi:hypothetical protein